MTAFDSRFSGARRTCAECGTELGVDALVCPACHALVHAARLKLLAARADGLVAEGKLGDARAAWEEALTLLPAGTQQHAAITARAEALAKRMADAADSGADEARAARAHLPWYRRWGAGVGAIALLLLTKAKFLLLGLAKLPTLFSMFGFFAVYWRAFGWPLALGFVVGIYIHEMGHVAALVRLGIKPTAPMFIPGVGAFISYSGRISDPREDAKVGLAGPIWGAGAGLFAFAVASWQGSDVWLAIATLTGFINLFNLIPWFGLDGSHGFKALDAPQRWAVAIAMGVAFWISGVKILVILAIIAVIRAVRKDQGPGDARTLANFIGLIAVLTWMATLAPILPG